MKVFVAGATGVLGWRAVRDLVAAGHAVTGIARSEEKATRLRSLGATPVRVDLFDADAVREAAAGHDAVLNLATHVPKPSEATRRRAWAEHERIRSEGARILVDAAVAGGASVYVQESLAFAYADGAHAPGPHWRISVHVNAASSPSTASTTSSTVMSAAARARR
jgi:nucleoside-diphosphate-sugar epimerase